MKLSFIWQLLLCPQGGVCPEWASGAAGVPGSTWCLHAALDKVAPRSGATGLVYLAPPPGLALPGFTLKNYLYQRAEVEGRFRRVLSLLV